MHDKRTELRWVSIDIILPNPLNPRASLGVKMEEMQCIIMERGWEEGLTVYPYGNGYYMILSGHRRWHAAKHCGVKEVPIYIVEAPKDDTEALVRMMSFQNAHVAWSKYEWTKTIHNAWVQSGRPSGVGLAEALNLSEVYVQQAIKIFEYYKVNEIGDKLEDGTFTTEGIYQLAIWLEKVKRRFPMLVVDLTEEIIRRLMLRKLEKKRTSGTQLSNDTFVKSATQEQMKDFIINPDITLLQARSLIGAEYGTRVGSWQGQLGKMTRLIKDLPGITPNSLEQAKILIAKNDELILGLKHKNRALRATWSKE